MGSKEVKILKGMPFPEKQSRLSKWKKIALKMKHGDSAIVENRSQATCLKNAIEKLDKCGCIRQIKPGEIGVWCFDYEDEDE